MDRRNFISRAFNRIWRDQIRAQDAATGVLIYGQDAGISDKHDVLFRNGFPCILKEYRFQNKENGYKAGGVTDLLGYRNACSQNHGFQNRYFYGRLPKSCHRMAAMGTEFPWRWGRGTICANLDVIWGMSAKRKMQQWTGSPL